MYDTMNATNSGMELLRKLYENDCNGAVYLFHGGYIVIMYVSQDVGNMVYYTTDLRAAKEAIGLYEEE